MSNPIKKALLKIKQEEEDALRKAETDFLPGQDSLTIGPDINSISGNYSVGPGSWNIHYVDKLSPDIILMYLARMSAMYTKVGSTNRTGPVPRSVKDVLLKDNFYVHTIPGLK